MNCLIDLLGVVKEIEQVKTTATFPSTSVRIVTIIDTDSKEVLDVHQIRLFVYGSLAENLSWEKHIGKVIAIKNAKLNCSTDGPFLTLSSGGKTIPWIFFNPATQCVQHTIVTETASLVEWYDTSYQEIRNILGSQSENVIIHNSVVRVADLLGPSNLGSNDGGAKVIVYASIYAMYPSRPGSHSQDLWIKTCVKCNSTLEINNASTFNCTKCRVATKEHNVSYKFSISIRESNDSNKDFHHSKILSDILVNNDVGTTLVGISAADFKAIHVYTRNPLIENLKNSIFKMTLHITKDDTIENTRVIVLEEILLIPNSTPSKQMSLPKPFFSCQSSSALTSKASGNLIK